MALAERSPIWKGCGALGLADSPAAAVAFRDEMPGLRMIGQAPIATRALPTRSDSADRNRAGLRRNPLEAVRILL
jgi:hypothetical protein